MFKPAAEYYSMKVRGHHVRTASVFAGFNLALVSIASIVHELGHAAAGEIFQCGTVEIVLFPETYTSMACSSPPVFLAGFVAVLPLSGIAYMLDRVRGRYAAFILAGFSLALAGADLAHLLGGTGYRVLAVLTGLTVAFYGEDRILRGLMHRNEPREETTK